VFAPCAAAALYRRDAFERVGGFDEQYFCYFEDVDLGFRLRLHGYSCIYVHQAVVRHVSSGISGYGSDFSLYHAERNIIWTFVKDMPGPLLWLYLPQHLALNIVALLYYPWRGQGTLVIQSKLDALRGLWRVLKQRRLVQRERAVGSLSLRRVFARGLLSPYVRAYAKGGLKNRHHALTHHDQV
jgi:GT2 family glycosyltransferase